jgi:hypothetical protein
MAGGVLTLCVGVVVLVQVQANRTARIRQAARSAIERAGELMATADSLGASLYAGAQYDHGVAAYRMAQSQSDSGDWGAVLQTADDACSQLNTAIAVSNAARSDWTSNHPLGDLKLTLYAGRADDAPSGLETVSFDSVQTRSIVFIAEFRNNLHGLADANAIMEVRRDAPRTKEVSQYLPHVAYPESVYISQSDTQIRVHGALRCGEGQGFRKGRWGLSFYVNGAPAGCGYFRVY